MLLFFNFSKAFNIISYNILAFSLGHWGLNGWTAGYLSSKKLFERLGSEGMCCTLTGGWQWVAQGSVLGPVHFYTVINSLGEAMQCTLLKFAGSIKLGWQFSTPEGRAAIWRDLDRLGEWTDRNFYKIQQGQMRRPALGKEETIAPE